MSKRRDLSIQGKPVRQEGSYFPAMMVLCAVSAIALGAGVILALPDAPDTKSQAASATASAPETTGSTTASVDESLCDKQAWPYVDQRCAQRVDAARGTRQVRIVTDKGNSVTVRTPEPIVEPKSKPAPPAPVVAGVEKPLGPPVAPVAGSPPQIEKVVAAPQQQVASAPQNPAPQAAPKVAPASTVQVTTAPQRSSPAPVAPDAAVAPAAASPAPVAAGVDAFADADFKKFKSARAAEKAAKREARREARRQRAIEEGNADVAEEVAATVNGRGSRRNRNAVSDRARNGVPEEVLQAVEQATASEFRGRRDRQVVTVGSTRNGTRIYMVPSNEAGGW